MERAGIPAVVITNLVTIAEQVGAPRIVQGRGIPYPAGDPDVPLQAERAWRRRLIMRCLEALATPVEQPTVFAVDTDPTAKEAADA